MKYLSIAVALAATLAASACSTQPPSSNPVTDITHTYPPAAPQEAILLVSLEDGSVIKQTISSNADLCFKMNSESTTTCLTQGAPVIDPVTNTIVGFKMIEEHIDLVAKTD
ncbi:MAG: hypothetical protein ACR2QT_14265 [Woeseiaceae bacterium]